MSEAAKERQPWHSLGIEACRRQLDSASAGLSSA